MDTKTYAVIDSDGQVLNCIVWDGVIPLPFQDQLVEYTEDKPAWVGGTYTDGVFLPPPEPWNDNTIGENSGN
jgi:hypothetical protein